MSRKLIAGFRALLYDALDAAYEEGTTDNGNGGDPRATTRACAARRKIEREIIPLLEALHRGDRLARSGFYANADVLSARLPQWIKRNCVMEGKRLPSNGRSRDPSSQMRQRT